MSVMATIWQAVPTSAVARYRKAIHVVIFHNPNCSTSKRGGVASTWGWRWTNAATQGTASTQTRSSCCSTS